MSDTGSNDPYDPNRPGSPAPGTPPPPPAAPQWGSNPPPPDQPDQPGGQWTGGQLSGQQYGQPAYGQPAGSPPPNYLVWAILSTVLCCLPLGVASIVYAAQVNSKYATGDLAGAQASSEKAKKFAIWSAVIWLVIGVLSIAVFVALVAGSDTST